jgi:hypothetical protein
VNPIKSADQLYNFIALVVVCAPDRFPQEDYLTADQQMTLHEAFEKLRGGIDVLYPEPQWAEKRQALRDILRGSLSAYESGDRIEGARLVHEFQDSIFKQR